MGFKCKNASFEKLRYINISQKNRTYSIQTSEHKNENPSRLFGSKTLLTFLFFLLFSSSSSFAFLNEDDEEQKLKTTAIKDLRVNQNSPSYRSGKFPVQKFRLTQISRTDFCSGVKEIAKLQKFSEDHTGYSLNIIPCEDGRWIVSKLENRERASLDRVSSSKDRAICMTHSSEVSYPFHGHIITKFSNGEEYVGSGTLVGPHHVLTAGHNIFSHKTEEGWATSVRFIPMHNEPEMSFGEAEGTILLSVNNWVEHKNKSYDFGMVILNKSIGYRTGWGGMIEAQDDLFTHISGYPEERVEQTECLTQMWAMREEMQMILGDQTTYKLNTYPGQNGSDVGLQLPDDKGYYVVGVHTYDERNQDNGNVVIRISPEKFKHLVSWMQKYQLRDFYHPRLSSAEEKKERALYVTYKSEAMRGDIESQYQLAVRYKKGRGVEENPYKALKWYREAAKRGHQAATRELALWYEKGQGIQKNVTSAIDFLLKLGNENGAWGQNKLGRFYTYKDGHCIAQDYTEAMHWFLLAAAQNYAPAQNSIGKLYHKGQGVIQNYGEALRWFRLAADQNYLAAQNNMGVLYKKGQGVPVDYAEAMYWFRLAAGQNYPTAQSNIGSLYKKGQGVVQNYVKAMHWHGMATDQNYLSAQNNIVSLYKKGQSVMQDYAKTIRWFRLTAAQNYPTLQNNIGVLYKKGQAIDQNYAEAMYWYQLALNQNDLSAQNNMGMFYSLVQDYAEGMRWFRLAADQNYAPAQNNIGMIYNLAQDYTEAMRWYQLAAHQNYAPAQYNIGRLYKKGYGVALDYVAAQRNDFWIKNCCMIQ